MSLFLHINNDISIVNDFEKIILQEKIVKNQNTPS